MTEPILIMESESRIVAAVVPPHSISIGTLIRYLWYGTTSSVSFVFGLVSLTIGLAVVATIPVLQLATLGYLLECSARVARSGRLRDGLPGVWLAGRFGGAILGTWVALLPLRFVSDLRYSAQLLDASESVSRRWNVAFWMLAALILGHIAWALFRGARLRHFIWPAPVALVHRLRRRRMYAEARDRTYDVICRLQIPHLLTLGLKGFLVAMIWLWLPISLMVIGGRLGGSGGGGVTVIGALLL
ncbi:MAG: hypothetical protein KDA60_15495 [Planctomycetales bacterium]|nr:hypothetical protein [Planctomycetales bacterium]